ncbi:MAG: glutamyl-tRNA reductase [Planctomycetia bacterium]|nr:glutamyl-tRNA reductase [Planctomycetia bacterium]
MRFRMLGLSHQTAPVEVRELFSFPMSMVQDVLADWSDVFPDAELVLVCTCNRTEIYVACGDGDLPSDEELFDFLQRERKVSLPQGNLAYYKEKYFRTLDDLAAITHLYAVVSSLDSMVVGEPQISSQIKSAYQRAVAEGTTGAVTNCAFQSAFRVAKRVFTETELFRHRVSIPSIAIADFALRIFERLGDKRTTILGAGEMAQESVRYLKECGGREIQVSNRSLEKAQSLADEFGGGVLPWSRRGESLLWADIIIAATGSDEYILTKEDYRRIAAQRRSRPLFILDLAVPRNIDPGLKNISNLFLYTIDDLQAACGNNRKLRDQEIPKAWRIVEQEAASFTREMSRRDSGRIISELRHGWNEIKEQELQRLFHKCPDLDAKTQSEVQYAFDRLVNKILHQPLATIKEETEEERLPRLVDAIRRIFHLGEGN